MSEHNYFRKHLFEHQKSNIQRMERLEVTNHISDGNIVRNTKIGILSDPPGYGKNVTMVQLLTRDVMKFDVNEPHIEEDITVFSGGLTVKRDIKKYDKIPVNLLVVTIPSLDNWKREFTYTNMKILCVDKMSVLDDNYDTIDTNDVVIVTPNMYNHIVITYKNKAWKRVIFDEPIYLNIPNMKWIKSSFYWFITSSSPREIAFTYQHFRKHFMKSIFGDINEDIEDKFSGNIISNDIVKLNNSCTLPKVKHYYHKIDYKHDIELSSGSNIKYIVKHVSNDIVDNVVQIIRDKEIKELNEIGLKREENKDDSDLSKQCNRIEEQIQQTKERIQSSINDICTICSNEIKEPIFESHCQNFFCSSCLLQWLQTKQTCPICREMINNNELILFRKHMEDGSEDHNKESSNTVIKKIKCIIDTQPTKKVLIFSNNNLDDELYKEFNNNSIKYFNLKGSDKRKVDTLHKFIDSSDINVLIAHSINDIACMEINISNIIICHEITLQVQDYLLSRLNRINKKDTIYVHHMSTEI